MKHFQCSKAVLVAVMLFALGAAAYAVAPICPHVIGWNGDIGTWATGAPWIKVIYSGDVAPAKAIGSKVFYRPYDADNNYHDDGNLPSGQSGSQYADLVWAKLNAMNPKPEAVGYRNEFNWDNPTSAKRTCAEFVNYKNRLRTLGYTGKIIFGSFGVGWVDTAIWDDSDCQAAVAACDGIETHEYFDLTVNCCAPWLCFRHRDIAIANHTELASKEWYIGEFGSDRVCGNCADCDDDSCRRGWQDSSKLSEAAFISQMDIYRQNVASQVVAVFLFQQGSGGWADFDIMNSTTVKNWVKGTWGTAPTTGTIAGTVLDQAGEAISGATVTAGSFSATTNSSGAYTMSNVTTGTYTVTASKSGFNSSSQTGKTVSQNQTTTVNFTLSFIDNMNSNAPGGSNLALSATSATADSQNSSGQAPGYAKDGTISTKWCSTNASSTHWLVYDLGATKTVNGYVLKNAGLNEPTYYNTKKFKIQSGTSTSGPWTNETIVDNSAQASTINKTYNSAKQLRYIRLYITNSGIDNYARIPEFEVWGSGGGGGSISENFETMPSWSSTFDAAWGSAATFSIVGGGQSGNFLQASRTSQGSSAKVKVYTVTANRSYTITVYIKCPSYSGSYWVETAYKLGSNTATDFDGNSGTWTQIKKFADTGTNGNGNVWTQYSATVNTGSNTQISIGYKHGASGCVGPTVGWDTFLMQ